MKEKSMNAPRLTGTWRRAGCGVIIAVANLALCDLAPAQSAVTPSQLIDRHDVSDPQWSKQGRLIVVVKSPPSGDEQALHLWHYDAGDDSFRQLTTIGERNEGPRWSPDGTQIAFLSTRGEEDKAQVFLLPMAGGEARRLTDDKAGVTAFEWSPSGTAIAFVSADARPGEETKKKQKDDERLASEAVTPIRLRVVDIGSRSVRSLTGDRWRVSQFAWRPDGGGLVIAATDNPLVEFSTDRLFVIDAETGKMRNLARPNGPFRDLSVSSDNRSLAYVGSDDGGPIPHALFVQPLSGGEPRNLTGESLDRLIEGYAWTDDRSLMALVAEGFGERMVRITSEGVISNLKSLPGKFISAFAPARGQIAFIAGGPVDPPELWLSAEGEDRQVSRLNDDFPTLISPTLIRYPGDGGREIEAALFRPHGRKGRDGYPAVALIHGGPAARWSHRLNDWAQLLAARGYLVIAPNIRGSTGYGLEFIRSNRRDWGGADYRDVLAGVDHLVGQGLADPDRLAIAGGSYGGYMAAWAITQTNRFKAAVLAAPMTDLAVEYGTENASINAYDTWYLGTPYENLDDFIRMSPMTFVKNAATPALILHGEEDDIDPIAQSWQFYRGLRRYGVETELVIYPREPHELKEEKHIIDQLSRMVEWIERHVT